MTDESERKPQETSVVRGSALDPLNKMFEKFMGSYTSFGFQARQQDIIYRPIPYKPDAEDKLLLEYPWRVMLELYSHDQRLVMGLDLYGDIILGRGQSAPGKIILDLDPHDAASLGVSREHLMLRPTKTHLYAIDQGSTNGTTVNGARASRGIALNLKNEDLIGLGNMMIMVHLIAKPGEVGSL
jgi:hypothetical protein